MLCVYVNPGEALLGLGCLYPDGLDGLCMYVCNGVDDLRKDGYYYPEPSSPTVFT